MSTETRANVPVTGWQEGVWYHQGRLAFTVMHHGWTKGVEDFRNRVEISVSGDRSVPESERESHAAQVADALNVTAQTGLTPRQLAERVETLKREAQIHAMEARTANATIGEIYQLCTGATGEPGNWNGAEPLLQLLGRHEQAMEALHLADGVARIGIIEASKSGLLSKANAARQAVLALTKGTRT